MQGCKDARMPSPFLSQEPDACIYINFNQRNKKEREKEKEKHHATVRLVEKGYKERLRSKLHRLTAVKDGEGGRGRWLIPTDP